MTTTTFHSAFIHGSESIPLTVSAELFDRLPAVVCVGLPSPQARETAERCRSTASAFDYTWPKKRVVLTFEPQGVNVLARGTACDIAACLAVLVESGEVKPSPASTRALYLGELGLDGAIRPVRGVYAHVLAARDRGIKTVIVPAHNFEEACLVRDICVLGARDLYEVIWWAEFSLPGNLRRREALSEPLKRSVPPDQEPAGNEQAKGDLARCAYLREDILLQGTTGCISLSRWAAGLLPELEPRGRSQVLRVHSAAGLPVSADQPRPFRAPHHTISAKGLAGTPLPHAACYNGRAHIGEVELASHGVLLLDELPEFQQRAIEQLSGVLADMHPRSRPWVIATARPATDYPEAARQRYSDRVNRYCSLLQINQLTVVEGTGTVNTGDTDTTEQTS
jgi:magnesium chelatase family protein